jgi:ligand-binding sensor domain-containing protein
VDALTFDNDGMLWMSCSAESANKDNILRLNPATGEWKEYNDAILKYNNNILYILRKSIRDNKGNIWIVNDHHLHPCLIRINPETETFTRFDNFVNQDGTKYEVHYVRCVEQDLDGNIWIGTDIGLFMYNEAQQADETLGFTQVKVPRNDGTDLADYLLTNTDITCITIDGANRKWIGTNSSGVYLISADNYTQLHNFTTENSPLLSNTIESIAVNPNTGETFFGTDMGLCSYMSDASAAIDEMKSDDVYAFPNPVPPGYNGLITVRGLSMNADVKILTISGKLVAEGHSNGGTFTWNGCDQSGRRVASGVYMIATATKDGKKGVVAKVAVVQ